MTIIAQPQIDTSARAAFLRQQIQKEREFKQKLAEEDDRKRGTYIAPGDSTKVDRAWGRLLMDNLTSHNTAALRLAGIKKPTEQESREAILAGRLDEMSYNIDFYPRNWSEGVIFWNNYPNDARRYQWLLDASNDGVWYFTDKEQAIKDIGGSDYNGYFKSYVDLQAWRLRDQQYRQLRQEFLSEPNVSDNDKNQILVNEIWAYSKQHLYRAIREGKKLDLTEVERRILLAAPYYYEHLDETSLHGKPTDAITMNIVFIFTYQKYFDLTLVDLKAFCKRLRVSGAAYPRIVAAAEQKLSLLKLQQEPFTFKATAIDGRGIDLSQFRGKVVLLDFWATWCSTCIAKMPEIKKVYEKYQSQGFEVISVNINPQIDNEKVLAVHDKIKVNWPVAIIGDKNKEAAEKRKGYWWSIWSKYGFDSVPQLLLLDKDGKLIAYNGDLLGRGMVEHAVKQALGGKNKANITGD